jgi:uncharacterized protein DUF6166
VKPSTVIYSVVRRWDCVDCYRSDGENGIRVAISPASSLQVANHSPTGFEFGYPGSGPAQLALAILLDFLDGEAHRAAWHHQAFKFRFVARWSGDRAEITGAAIVDFLHEAEAEDVAFESAEEVDHAR